MYSVVRMRHSKYVLDGIIITVWSSWKRCWLWLCYWGKGKTAHSCLIKTGLHCNRHCLTPIFGGHIQILRVQGRKYAAATKLAQPGSWEEDWKGSVEIWREQHTTQHETRCSTDKEEQLTGACGGAPWFSLPPSLGKATACSSSGSLCLLHRHSRQSPLWFTEEEGNISFSLYINVNIY